MEPVAAFKNLLPKKPYWTHDPKRGVRIGKNLSATFLQPNSPFVVNWLVIDVDHPLASQGLFDSGTHIPAPNIIVGNKKTGHAHYYYQIDTPVLFFKTSAKAPQVFLRDTKAALDQAIPGADPNYHGPLARNPLNADAHSVRCPRKEPYTLAELREWGQCNVKLSEKCIRASDRNSTEQTGSTPIVRNLSEHSPASGRNCSLFSKLSSLAKQKVSRYSSFDTFYNSLKDLADGINQKEHTPPLHSTEVAGVVRSVAKWVWARRLTFSEKANQDRVKNQRQVDLGRRGGVASGESRRQKATVQFAKAERLAKEGFSIRGIARVLGVAPSTVSRWGVISKPLQTDNKVICGVLHEAIKDNSPLGASSSGQMPREPKSVPREILQVVRSVPKKIEDSGTLGKGFIAESRSGAIERRPKGLKGRQVARHVQIVSSNVISPVLYFRPSLSRKEIARMQHAYAFNSRLSLSQTDSPAFLLESLKKIFPEAKTILSLEGDMAAQKAGIDLALYAHDIETFDANELKALGVTPIVTIDKKERFTNPKTKQVYDKDIALEMFKGSPKTRNTAINQWTLAKYLDDVAQPFYDALKTHNSIEKALTAANQYAEQRNIPINVTPGWATMDLATRTVDGTLYVIAPKGRGWFVDEKKLRDVFSQDFAAVFEKSSALKATVSYESGQVWGVKNLAVPLSVMQEFMPLPVYDFTPYDRTPIDKNPGNPGTVYRGTGNSGKSTTIDCERII